MERSDLEYLARRVAHELERTSNVEVAPKWQHGMLIFKPADDRLKQHEISIERFMHKIVMMRDNLRVLEQQINSNKSLEIGEKIKLQSYITRIYGSMTSFNMFFADEDDTFKGSGGE